MSAVSMMLGLWDITFYLKHQFKKTSSSNYAACSCRINYKNRITYLRRCSECCQVNERISNYFECCLSPYIYKMCILVFYSWCFHISNRKFISNLLSSALKIIWMNVWCFFRLPNSNCILSSCRILSPFSPPLYFNKRYPGILVKIWLNI